MRQSSLADLTLRNRDGGSPTYVQIVAKDPDALWYLNQLAFMACVNQDRPTAKAAFEKIGDRYESDVWGQPYQLFVPWREWALNPKAPQPKPLMEK